MGDPSQGRQVSPNQRRHPNTHHDAIEFADGRIVLLTRLKAGQRATVLQLPARPQTQTDKNSPERTARRVYAR